METVVAVRPGVRAFRNAAEAIQIQLPLKGGELEMTLEGRAKMM